MRLRTLALAALLAGCLAAEAPGEAPAAAPVSAVVPGADDCLQYHTFYPSPAEPFRGFVPEGFALRTEEGGTVNVGVGASLCADDAAELVATIPVVPPDALANESLIELVPIDVVASPALAEAYEAFGVPAAPGAIQREVLAGAETVTATSDGGAYVLRVALRPATGSFEQPPVRLWVVEDGKAVGSVVVTLSPSAQRGYGPVAFAYEGSGGAPPAHAGIAHSVEGVSMRWTRLSLPG